jgi:hypothetical protein
MTDSLTIGGAASLVGISVRTLHHTLAERHRATIAEHFDCTHAMQVCMVRTFTPEYYDHLEPGLTAYLQAVVNADATTHGINPETARWE